MTGSQLQNLRVSLKLSQAALAKTLGVSQSTVSRWESEAIPISRVEDAGIRAICAKLKGSKARVG